MYGPLFLLIPILLTGCDRDALYEQKSLTSSIQEVWKDCDPAEIDFFSVRHGIQTAFANCGANTFSHFSWSPDGLYIYFQLTTFGYIMNAEEKTIMELPLPQNERPASNASWLSNDLLVVPIGESEEHPHPRLALYKRSDNSLTYLPLEGLAKPTDIQTAGSTDAVYFAAKGQSGDRTLHIADFSDKTVNAAFPWLKGPVDSFTYSPGVDQVAWGLGTQVKVAEGKSGQLLHEFDNATRGSVHADGRLIALETTGDPISMFRPKGKTDKSEAGQRRQKAREELWKEEKPDWMPSEISPPALDIVDTEIGRRYRLELIHGSYFQWYPGHPEYASFVMWGLERKQLNKNVALTALGARILRLAEKDEMPSGIRLVSLPTD